MNKKLLIVGCILLCKVMIAKAEAPETEAIYSASQDIRELFNPMSDFILAIGALVGTYGGLRVYIKWNTGEHHVTKDVIGWVGACIFLELVGVIMHVMFM